MIYWLVNLYVLRLYPEVSTILLPCYFLCSWLILGMTEKSPFSHPSSSLLPQSILSEMLCFIVWKHGMHINMILRYLGSQICVLLLSASKEERASKSTTKVDHKKYQPNLPFRQLITSTNHLCTPFLCHCRFLTHSSYTSYYFQIFISTAPNFFSRLLFLPHSACCFSILWYLGGRKSMTGDRRGQGWARVVLRETVVLKGIP